MSEFLEIAKEAALKAGKVIMNYYAREVKHEKKSDNTFFSEADLAAEKIILDIIMKKFPEHSYYSEEKGASKKNSEFCWYIDPLDGTHNFIHKMPLFSVTIGLARNGKFILGVIFDPIHREMYYAEIGKGAFLNGKEIKVSNRIIKDSIIAVQSSFYKHNGNISKLIKKFENQCKELRVYCSCSIENAYVASGKMDIYIKTKTSSFDVGPCKVIIEEAGGKLTQIDGSEFTLESKNFIASNGVFHDEIIKILKEEEFK